MTDMSPRVVLQFPKRHKADCQGERLQNNVLQIQLEASAGISAETAAKLNLARAIGRAKRAAEDKILDGFMELTGATSPADAVNFLQDLLDRSRGKAS